MTNQKPTELVPPRELVQRWRYAASNKAASITGDDGRFDYIDYIVTQAAQWGFNQRGAIDEAALQKARDEELEACCEQLRSLGPGQRTIDNLRAARRPKPKSQAEEARQRLEDLIALIPTQGALAMAGPIRAALERLRELEKSND